MEQLHRMPRRMPSAIEDNNVVTRKEYSYEKVVNYGIKPENIAYITISKDDLIYSLAYLNNILDKDKDIRIKLMDWESVCYIDKNMKKKIENQCYLVDDGVRMSREYIDLTKLNNIRLIVPLNYLMWGIKFNDLIDTYCFQIENDRDKYLNFTSLNGNKSLSIENLEKIRKKIIELNSNGKLSDSEKVALISDFVQSHTQYIDGLESVSGRGIFITPDFPKFDIQVKKSGLVETVLNDHNGICMGIANLCTLLLNNPEFNLETESMYGCSHVWNRVLIDGKYYYFDNTWNIARTNTPCEDGLITLSFSNKYNLFGKNKALNIGYHIPASIPVYNNGVLSEEDYQKLGYKSRFTYPSKPFYRSYKK